MCSTVKALVVSNLTSRVYTVEYLCYAYNVSSKTFYKRWTADTLGKQKPEHRVFRGSSVIDNLELCIERYTQKYFYAKEKAMSGDPPLITPMPKEWNYFTYRMAYWGGEYENVKEQHHHYLSRLVRQHLARQPFIKDEILDALKGDICRSYRSLTKFINGWCCATTIY